jgi:trehalose synthase-fused probable maltokinase
MTRSAEAAEWLSDLKIERSAYPALVALEREILPRYLAERRWYGAKDAGLPAVSFERVVPVGGLDSRFLVCTLRVDPPGQAGARYFLPLAFVGGEAASEVPVIARVSSAGEAGVLVDAFFLDEFVRELLVLICNAETRNAVHGDLRAHGSPALREYTSQLLHAEIQRSSAEQSNTSLRIAGVAMLKGLRRLEAGTHPELEIGRFLTEVARFGNAPAFLGSVELASGHAEAATSLCVMQELVPNEGDGWSYVLAQLARAASVGGTSSQRSDALLELAERLGRRTADLHRALSTETADSAFAPEAATPALLTEWSHAAQRMATTAMDSLQRHIDRLSGAGRRAAEALLARRGALDALLGTLIAHDAPVTCTRLHGDYHLGQVLVTDHDVFIIDFEGEPLRSLEERRAKHCALKDVAGMLRSIDYAGAAATRARGESGGAGSDAIARCTSDMADLFLKTYETTIAGCAAYPQSADVADRLIRLFLFEKACYEIAYEIANRPEWVDIPVTGVLTLLDSKSSR